MFKIIEDHAAVFGNSIQWKAKKGNLWGPKAPKRRVEPMLQRYGESVLEAMNAKTQCRADFSTSRSGASGFHAGARTDVRCSFAFSK